MSARPKGLVGLFSRSPSPAKLKMAYEFKMQRAVEFWETDMAGIAHFSNFFRWMESVEHAFFRSLDLSVHPHSVDGVWGWARVNADCSFRGPLRYEDVFEMHLLVREKRRRSFDYIVVFRKREPGQTGSDPTWVEVARGSMTTVCVSKREGGSGIRAIEMPRDVTEKIGAAPAAAIAPRAL